MALIFQGTGYEIRPHAPPRLVGNLYSNAVFRRITSDNLAAQYIRSLEPRRPCR